MTSLVCAFLCFTGICIMFFYLVRSLEKFQEHTRDEHAQLRVQIRALEARLDSLASATPPSPPANVPPPGDAPLASVSQSPPE
jgi:hypothetical protein